ncbi:MAG: hypothetical protein SNJ80_01080 [Anaerolinea sp.]
MTRAALRRDAVLMLIAAALGTWYVLGAGGGFPLDDSWIHQVYGRNFGTLGEWSFIPGEPSTASTSPLYTVLLAVGYRLGLPFAAYTHALGIASLALMGVLGARFAAVLLPDRPWIAWAVGLALVGTWHHVWAAGAGMEAIILMMLSFALYLAVVHEQAAPRFSYLRAGLFGVGVALATLTRPEGILLGAVCGLTLVVLRPRGLLDVVRFGGVSAAVCGVVLLPYLLFNLQQTGGLLPNTGAAKFRMVEALLAQPLPVRYWGVFAQMIVGPQAVWVVGLIPYVLLVRQASHKALFVMPLAWYAAQTILYAIQLPAPMQHGRYFLPALPSLVFAGVVGVCWWLVIARRQRLGRVASRVVALSGASTALAFVLLLGWQAYVTDVRIINEEQVTSALWIRDNLPPDELLALYDIGAVGYFAGRSDLLDVAGLIDPDVIPLLGDPDSMWTWMREQGAAYFFGFPYQIPGGNPNDPRLCRVFITNSPTTLAFDTENMSVYRIAWDENCETSSPS